MSELTDKQIDTESELRGQIEDLYDSVAFDGAEPLDAALKKWDLIIDFAHKHQFIPCVAGELCGICAKFTCIEDNCPINYCTENRFFMALENTNRLKTFIRNAKLFREWVRTKMEKHYANNQ